MRQALRLAAKARGQTHPNPLVGAVIVKDGAVLATGYHHRAGSAHAEVDALAKLSGYAAGATAYVTLEPCNHHGRTGPCSEALVAAKVARVVCGMRDPNHVAAGGLERLRAAGITVECGVLQSECRALNREWLHFLQHGRPFVTLKAAITLDGRLAARGGDSRWVSSEASRREAHRLRSVSDAILVGANTVSQDDPALTTRLSKNQAKHSPQRVILDGRLSISATAKALPSAWVITSSTAPQRDDLRAAGAEIVRLPSDNARLAMKDVLSVLGQRGITALLVEGGGDLHGQLLACGLVDQVVLFVAPKLIGAGGVPLIALPGPEKMAEAWQLENVRTRRLGDDILISGTVRSL